MTSNLYGIPHASRSAPVGPSDDTDMQEIHMPEPTLGSVGHNGAIEAEAEAGIGGAPESLLHGNDGPENIHIRDPSTIYSGPDGRGVAPMHIAPAGHRTTSLPASRISGAERSSQNHSNREHPVNIGGTSRPRRLAPYGTSFVD